LPVPYLFSAVTLPCAVFFVCARLSSFCFEYAPVNGNKTRYTGPVLAGLLKLLLSICNW
jgi:hypothetical protein